MIVKDISPTKKTPMWKVLEKAGVLENSCNVILEGLNCVGKSTVAKLLCGAKDRPTNILTLTRKHEVPDHIVRQFDHFSLGQYRLMLELVRQSVAGVYDCDFVIDRCHPSAYVFGDFEWQEVAFCEENLPSGLVGLYLYADDDIVKQRMKDKGESDDLYDMYNFHKRRYEDMLEYSKIPFIKINTSLTTV
jgi:thymidylate kinase